MLYEKHRLRKGEKRETDDPVIIFHSLGIRNCLQDRHIIDISPLQASQNVNMRIIEWRVLFVPLRS